MSAHIAVIGATGAQGGSVARHLLATGKYRVRCISRTPSSNKAMALAKLGAEVVHGDLENSGSLLVAMRGCDGVFGMTMDWIHSDREYAQGRNLVDAIAQLGLTNVVLSTLPSAMQLSGGRVSVAYFDTKARIEEYARSRGLAAAYVHIAFHYENIVKYFPVHKHKNGNYGLAFPQGSAPLAGVSAEDIGGVVTRIFSELFWYKNKVVAVVGDDLRGEDYAEVLSRVVNKKISYEYMSRDAFEKLDFPEAKDVATMLEFNRVYVANRKSDVARSREIYPALRSFERWAIANGPALQRLFN